ncbi:NUDIX hydrolase [Aspergillus candidus]|uniref:NUDIX domain protein n=1 Tax=Aspergillus candidus TaxID=41067 RepID=A0A2I2FCJ2_ASPCN|nr:NUDIX domain protein [Aspergillus candidus]PLB38353.1 NUDIX domain protein [Aspergillus candidus]
MRSLPFLRFLRLSRPFTTNTMPRLNPASEAAIERLRTFRPPPTSYDLVPLSRRAAVLLLLYADPQGDLRVVLTIRAKTLSSYAGQAALPGGRADSLTETPFQTARREAHEEIGLPDNDALLPRPFRVEHICEIPSSLARTELVVRPCVALLHAVDPVTGETTDPEETLIPRLDAREVAAVFTAPFAQFLRATDDPRWGSDNPTEWYQGAWTEWHRENWRMHQFFVPIDPKTVVKPRSSNQAQQEAASALEEKERSGAVTRYRVFGMTARILVDVARLAYAREPEFEHNSHFGDERLIAQLREMGRLSPARKRGDELTREDLEMASQVGMRSEKSKLS